MGRIEHTLLDEGKKRDEAAPRVYGEEVALAVVLAVAVAPTVALALGRAEGVLRGVVAGRVASPAPARRSVLSTVVA
jgi:hypothetical protein